MPHGPRTLVGVEMPDLVPSAPVPSMPRILLSTTRASTICMPATEPYEMPFLPFLQLNWRLKRAILN